MASTLGECSTIDELTVDDSTYDRYSVNSKYRNGKDGEESTLQPLSLASESSYDSRTYVTSVVSEGSQTLEHDDSSSDDSDDIDNLSLESQPMAMDHWVDNSCACLDYPAMVYQRMCMQTETSLLRESTGKPRATILNIATTPNSPTNLGIAAAKRRNVRLANKGGSKTEGSSERTNEMRKMQIQPREDFERKRFDTPQTLKEEPEERIATDAREGDEPTESRSDDSYESERIPDKTKLNEVEETDSTKSMLERAIQKVAKEDEERDIHIHLSNSSKDGGKKADPPSGDRYSPNLQDMEPSTPENPEESAAKKEEQLMEIPDEPSGRNERSSLPATEHETGEEVSQKSDSAQRTDEKSSSSSVEIIDVISIDDQDSWTPGSRSEVDHSTTKIESTLPQPPDAPSIALEPDAPSSALRPDDPSVSSTRVASSQIDDQRHDRLFTSDASTVDELWIEEEAKLNMRESSTRTTPSALKQDHVAAKSAEDLWNEERKKLQTISDVVIRSQSRRELIQKVLRGQGRDSSLTRRREIRTTSAGRSRPSADFYADTIEQSRSSLASRSMILQQGSGDSFNAFLLPSRSKDLVAVRSIEEGQRIRSSKREDGKYSASSHQLSARSRYDDYPDPSLQQPELDRLIRSISRERSRRGDPAGRRDFANDLMSDSRDDQDSHPSTPLAGKRSTATHFETNRSGYENAVLATKELRKLEKKIERQIRKADVEAQMEQTKEKRRMEKKLSKKLRSIMKSDDMNARKMSSKDIKKLEKQLDQTLNGDNENRSSKLKRIKHKERQRFSSSHESPNELRQSNGYSMSHSQAETPYLQESREKRPERSRYEDLKSLRSRYTRRGIGRRSYSRMTDTD